MKFSLSSAGAGLEVAQALLQGLHLRELRLQAQRRELAIIAPSRRWS